jgi:hypothetical protein
MKDVSKKKGYRSKNKQAIDAPTTSHPPSTSPCLEQVETKDGDHHGGDHEKEEDDLSATSRAHAIPRIPGAMNRLHLT